MSRKITLTIRGSGETDFPSVEDFSDQLRDHIEVLKQVEQAIGDGTNAVVWRVVKTETKSPVHVEAEAFSIHYAVHIDDRADAVARHAALGLQTLIEGRERPSYFTDEALRAAEKIFERVTNGLDTTVLDYGPDLPRLEITPPVARAALNNTHKVLRPDERQYEELGSIEGYAKKIETDGYGRHLLWVHHRLTGEDIKCVMTGDAFLELEKHRIGDVWKGRRVQVYGRLHYKGLGRLSSAEALSFRFLRERNELPDIDDIQDTNFTGGQRSEDYLARLWNGERS
jgi:hypothetical protein